MSRKKELLKYMFVICSSVILGIFAGAIYLRVRSLLPKTYEFCSAVNTGEDVVTTTDYISVPVYMCEEGEIEVNNSTGYEIFLDTRENGFQRVGQENFTMKITPVCLFVIRPETEDPVNRGGDFTIKNEKGEKITYHIVDHNESITVSSKEVHM